MSDDSILWMGNIQEWMNEKKIMQYFIEYGFNPYRIKLLKNISNCFSNYCFVYFYTIEEANNALNQLSGKPMPTTYINFELKWANPKFKDNNIEIFVANFSSEIDHLELYNLFKEKYPNVHHVSIINDKNNKSNKSKGYGFIHFFDKIEAEKCVNEMNGYLFHNKPLKVKSNIKDDDIQNEVNLFSENFEDIELNFIGILKGNKAPVNHLVCTEHENGVPLLFSTSKDSTIIKWKLYFKDKKFKIISKYDEKEKIYLGKPEKIFHAHNNKITRLLLDYENNKLISSSLDRTIKLWDIPSLTPEFTIEEVKNEILSVCHYGENIISSGNDKKVKIWNMQGKFKYIITYQKKEYVTCIFNLKNPKYLNHDISIALGFSDGTVRIFDDNYNLKIEIPLNDKIKDEKLKSIQNDEEHYSVVSMSVDEDGEFLFIGFKNGKILIWYLNDYECGDNNIKRILNISCKLNKFLYINEFYEIVFVGSEKGLIIKGIKDDETFKINNTEDCLSLCFDKSKTYLFAGFKNGIIKVFQILRNNFI